MAISSFEDCSSQKISEIVAIAFCSKQIQPQVFYFFGANNFYFGRSDLIIGTEWLHRVLGPCLAPQSDTFNISRFSGGEFMKIQDVERRKLPFFQDFFVNTTPI